MKFFNDLLFWEDHFVILLLAALIKISNIRGRPLDFGGGGGDGG